MTHGLTAAEIVVVNEQPDQFEAFRESLTADFELESTIERELVERLAGLLWCLRRVPVVEAELLSYLSSPYEHYNLGNLSHQELKQLGVLLQKAGIVTKKPTRLGLVEAQSPDETSAQPNIKKPEKLPRRVEMLTILSRYEAALMNAVTRTFSLLGSLKAARAAAVDDARTLNS